MEIEYAQKMMRRLYFKRDRARGINGTLERTSDELTELSDAIIQGSSKQSLEEEIADVFAWLCSLANLLDVDISTAFYTKYTDVCSKCRQSPCSCPEDADS